MDQTALMEQPVKKSFFQYTSLGVLSMIGTSLFILADTFFIANGIGADGIAALNIVLPAVNIFNGLGWMFGVGGATLFSIEKARGNIEEGQADFTLTVVLAVLVSILFSVIMMTFAEPILRFLGAEGHIFEMSASYYTVIMRFAPFFIINNMMITFMRNDNNPKLAMIALLTGGITNIILDYIFIFPLNMGMRGAALATVTSPVVSMFVSTWHLKNHSRQLAFRSFKVKFKKIVRIFAIGFSSFLNEFSSAVVMFLFNIILLQLVGNIAVSAYGIIANMNIVVIAIFTGMGQGFQPLVSMFYGARKTQTVKKVLKYALGTAIAFGILIFAIGFLFPETIVSLFNNEQNQQLVELAVPGLVFYFSSFLFTGVNFAVIYFMSAVGRSRSSLIISLLRGLLLIVPVLFLLANWLGVTGVWLTMTVVEVLTFIVSVYILYTYQKAYLK
jgi:putative MATE family efflux protein